MKNQSEIAIYTDTVIKKTPLKDTKITKYFQKSHKVIEKIIKICPLSKRNALLGSISIHHTKECCYFNSVKLQVNIPIARSNGVWHSQCATHIDLALPCPTEVGLIAHLVFKKRTLFISSGTHKNKKQMVKVKEAV